jgi:hypothetical protein
MSGSQLAAQDLRIQLSRPSQAPEPADQHTVRQKQSDRKIDDVNDNILSYIADLNAKAASIAKKYDYTVRYCLDLSVNVGTQIVKLCNAGNSYNAYISAKAKEMYEG